MKKLNVAIIGAKFMGKAHSSAWSRVHRFFDVPFEPVLKVACGRPEEPLQVSPTCGDGSRFRQTGERR